MKNYTIKSVKTISNESERVALNFDYIPFTKSELDKASIVEVRNFKNKQFQVLEITNSGMYIHQLTKKGELNKKTGSTFTYFCDITVAYFEEVSTVTVEPTELVESNELESIDFSNTNIEVDINILLYAMKYAMSNPLFVGRDVMTTIASNVRKLKPKNLRLLIHEIETSDYLGLDYDKLEWIKFKKYLETKLNIKNSKVGV